jgi:hypothetical protein
VVVSVPDGAATGAFVAAPEAEAGLRCGGGGLIGDTPTTLIVGRAELDVFCAAVF